MVGMIWQARITDPLDLGMSAEIGGQTHGVVTDAIHAQGKGFDALQDHERVEWRNRRTHVAKRHHARATDVGSRPQGLGINHPVVADIGLIQAWKALLVLRPGKLATIHNGASHTVAMTGQILGERMHDDVGTMVDGAHEVGAGHGVVHDQRHPMRMGDLGQRGDIRDVTQWVANRLAVDGLGFVINQLGKTGRVTGIGEPDLNALLRESVSKEVIGAAIQRAGRNDVVARLRDRLDGIGNGGHARGNSQRGNATLQRGHSFFQNVGGRVHDAGVDIARYLEVKQVRTVLRTVKRISDCLINGNSNGLCRGIRRIAGVNSQGFDFHELTSSNGMVKSTDQC